MFLCVRVLLWVARGRVVLQNNVSWWEALLGSNNLSAFHLWYMVFAAKEGCACRPGYGVEGVMLYMMLVLRMISSKWSLGRV